MSYEEVNRMPAARQMDFLFILSVLSEEREAVKKEPKPAPPPAPPPRRRK